MNSKCPTHGPNFVDGCSACMATRSHTSSFPELKRESTNEGFIINSNGRILENGVEYNIGVVSSGSAYEAWMLSIGADKRGDHDYGIGDVTEAWNAALLAASAAILAQRPGDIEAAADLVLSLRGEEL